MRKSKIVSDKYIGGDCRVMDFTLGQEKIFKIFDEIINQGGIVWEEIQSNQALRKRINREFSSVNGMSKTESALFLYGFNDFCSVPTILELKRCWEVVDWEVRLNKEYFNELLGVYNINEEYLMKLVNEHKEEVVLNLLSEFALNHPDKFYDEYFKKLKHHSLRYFIYKKFGDFSKARAFFGVPDELTLIDRPYLLKLSSLGREFEGLLEKWLFEDLDRQVNIDDCRPDFVDGSLWIDAKLSKSTAFYSGVETIPKYSEKVEKVLIIYAVDDMLGIPTLPENVEIKHISEFYEEIEKEGVEEINEFIKRVEFIKGISL